MEDLDILDAPATLRRSDYWRGYRQNFYPHHFLSAMMYRATRLRFAAWKNWQIRWFIQRYRVDMDAAIHQEPDNYPDFNSFFTRTLRPECRPIDANHSALVSPADGTVSQFGDIGDGRVLQAKGQHYSVRDFLGGDSSRADAFRGGKYLTVYLSPKDYHRVHMPYGGTLRETVHIPGRLFSVNPCATQVIPNLFARNERVVSIFDTEMGRLAVVLVGAVFVGSIDMCWPFAQGKKSQPSRVPAPVAPLKGEEIGRFNMGSTVVVLFANPQIVWTENVTIGRPVQMGTSIATLVS